MKSKRLKFFSASVVLLAFTIINALCAKSYPTQFNGSNAVVNVDKENLRKAPKGQKMGELLKNTELEIIEQKDNWTKVRVTGWIWTPSIKIPEGSKKASIKGTVYWTTGSGTTKRYAGREVTLLKIQNSTSVVKLVANLSTAAKKQYGLGEENRRINYNGKEIWCNDYNWNAFFTKVVLENSLKLEEFALENDLLNLKDCKENLQKELRMLLEEVQQIGTSNVPDKVGQKLAEYKELKQKLGEFKSYVLETKTSVDGEYNFSNVEAGNYYLLQCRWATAFQSGYWLVPIQIQEAKPYTVDLTNDNLIVTVSK